MVSLYIFKIQNWFWIFGNVAFFVSLSVPYLKDTKSCFPKHYTAVSFIFKLRAFAGSFVFHFSYVVSKIALIKSALSIKQPSPLSDYFLLINSSLSLRVCVAFIAIIFLSQTQSNMYDIIILGYHSRHNFFRFFVSLYFYIFSFPFPSLCCSISTFYECAKLILLLRHYIFSVYSYIFLTFIFILQHLFWLCVFQCYFSCKTSYS